MTIPIQTQYLFHPIRKWRLDFAFPEIKLGVEIQGYGEGHAAYASMANDHTKNNEAVLHGWNIIYLMSYQLQDHNIQATVKYVESIVLSRSSGTMVPAKKVGVDVKSIFEKLHNDRAKRSR